MWVLYILILNVGSLVVDSEVLGTYPNKYDCKDKLEEIAEGAAEEFPNLKINVHFRLECRYQLPKA